MRFTELAALTGGTLVNSEKAHDIFRGISIDSREIKPGELFIAIRGETNDGHNYVDQAIGKGAAGVMVDASYSITESKLGNAAAIAVVNSHQAMIDLARQYRDSIDGKFVGITGSNGKTTTKELAYRLLKAVEPNCYRSPGNLNNLYGVPLSLFSVEKDARAVVLEMGISTRNEMPILADIVHPDVIVITNVGPSHLEFLDTVEAVAQSKLELVRRAKPEVPVIINGDDSLLVRETKRLRPDFLTFALDGKADFTISGTDIDADGVTRVVIDAHTFRLPLVGRHQVANLLAAYAIVRTLGYDFAGIDTAGLALDTAPMRGQRMVLGGITFVADCYNANPESVRAGLETFFQTAAAGRRIVILGDMLELGAKSEQYHRRVGSQLAANRFDKAILVGEMAKYIMEEAVAAGADKSLFEHHMNAAGVAASAKNLLKAGDFVYVKGSRGIGLEAVLKIYESSEVQN